MSIAVVVERLLGKGLHAKAVSRKTFDTMNAQSLNNLDLSLKFQWLPQMHQDRDFMRTRHGTLWESESRHTCPLICNRWYGRSGDGSELWAGFSGHNDHMISPSYARA